MDDNPYRAPSADADKALDVGKPGRWTVWSALRQMAAAVGRQPGMAALMLFVLPSLWALPAWLLERTLVPVGAPISGPERPWLAIVVPWARIAWDGVWFPGALLAAINAVENRRLRLQDYIVGLRSAPLLFLASMLITLPIELASLLRLQPDSMLANTTVGAGVLVTMFLVIRTMPWEPLLLQRGQPFWGSLALSWNATQGHTLRIIGLGLALGLLALPVLVVESAAAAGNLFIGVQLFSAFTTLAMAQVYALLKPAANRTPNG